MKLKAHSVQRQGEQISVNAAFHDRFRKPMEVRIVTSSPAAIVRDTIWAGDPHDVLGLFGGLAEIAWDMGWRPRGFEGRLVQTVRTFKIPPEEG